jgi:hypothetical protein
MSSAVRLNQLLNNDAQAIADEERSDAFCQFQRMPKDDAQIAFV